MVNQSIVSVTMGQESVGFDGSLNGRSGGYWEVCLSKYLLGLVSECLRMAPEFEEAQEMM
jgi:hypothetical protein